MMNRFEARYFVVRYMHDELRDEAANVGVILVPREGEPALVRFLDDVTSKSRLDSRIDAKVVEDFETWVQNEVERLGRSGAEMKDYANSFEKALRDQTGNVVRLSAPRTVLLTDPLQEVEVLFNEWVAPRRKQERVESRARDPLGGLRRAARSAIVRTLRESLGAPLARQLLQKDVEVVGEVHVNRFDAAVAMGHGREERLFHHVLVLPEPEESYNQAAAVARRWMDVRSRKGPRRSLTAVLYSRTEIEQTAIKDAKQLLKHDDIEVASLQRVARFAHSLSPSRLF
jgi:hypothetical protein